jgi:hypothetical protein
MADVTPVPPRSAIPVIARIVLAVLALAPGIAGLAAFLLMAITWIIQGFHYEVSDRTMVPPILFVSQFCFMFSVVVLGIILRYARWSKAPTASLWLAAISCPVIVIGSILMVDALGVEPGSDVTGLYLVTGIGLLIVSLPPFLHWRKSRKTPAMSMN